jgi:hypothetical protein
MGLVVVVVVVDPHEQRNRRSDRAAYHIRA